MTRRAIAWSALLVVAAAGLEAQPWKGRGRLQGRVLDPEGEPIAGATVLLRQGRSEEGPEALETDAKGRWSFLGLASGRWTIRIEHPGFVPSEGTAPVRTGPASPIQVTLRRPEPAEVEPPPVLEQLEAGNRLLAEGRYAEARETYEAALGELPPESRPTVLLAIARTHYEEENSELAIGALERALAIDPSHGEALRLIGSLMVAAGREAEAESYIARLPEGESLDADAYLNVGIEHFNAGRMEDALAEFERVIQRFPDHPDSYYYRGLVHLSGGSHGAAKSDFQTLLELAPEHPNAAEARQFLDHLGQE